MTLQVKALIEWYQHQYDATKSWVQDECSHAEFWAQGTAEEQLISKLVYMTQLRNKIEGLKGGGKD